MLPSSLSVPGRDKLLGSSAIVSYTFELLHWGEKMIKIEKQKIKHRYNYFYWNPGDGDDSSEPCIPT